MNVIMTIEENVRKPGTAAGWPVSTDDQRLAAGLAEVGFEANSGQLAQQPIRGSGTIGCVSGIGGNAGKTQQFEQAVKTLRELLIYLREN